jgi:hypothetical protein
MVKLVFYENNHGYFCDVIVCPKDELIEVYNHMLKH